MPHLMLCPDVKYYRNSMAVMLGYVPLSELATEKTSMQSVKNFAVAAPWSSDVQRLERLYNRRIEPSCSPLPLLNISE